MLDVQNRNNLKLFIFPFLASDDGWMSWLLKNVFICNKALGMLFEIGCYGMTVLVQHATNHTLSIHRNIGRVPKITTKFQQNVVSPIVYFFKNHLLPMARARPTQYTNYAVTQTVTERDTNPIMELDPPEFQREVFPKNMHM